MTEALQYIEIGVFIIAVLFSLGVGLKLRHNAKAHEESAHSLDKKIERAINLRGA